MSEHSYNVRADTIASIRAYVDYGLEPGGFVTSVLENDLRGSMGRADSGNRAALFDIVSYCYNEIPGNCWGSPERVAAWLERHSAARAAKEAGVQP